MFNKNNFSKKKLLNEYLLFDWENYVKTYEDLKDITSKENAWYHYINYGKHENRKIPNVINNINEFNSFDWEKYIKYYDDLKDINTKYQAYNHWLIYGKQENRIFFNLNETNETNELDESNFDWEKYVNDYDDLKHIKSKEEAWNHWLKYGKNENRITNLISSSLEKTNDYINSEEFISFDWESYVSNYDDLTYINSKEDAWNHWLQYGKQENRICDNIFLFDDYKNFNWSSYINNYDDLKYLNSKEDAWRHYIFWGFFEDRKIDSIYENELSEYNKSLENEINFKEIDYTTNKIIFKKKYDNCGKHYFGWKGTLNYLIENYSSSSNSKFKYNYYFDEWIEKLLVWGNKIQNKDCLDNIIQKNLQLITFLHCPPFNNNYDKSAIILNDDIMLNKNIVNLIETNNLFYSITFLYVLSLDHKKYICDKYPKFKNKIISIYHPINIGFEKEEELFNINSFLKNRKFYHIGWWLRNFQTFFDFKVPLSYNKFILIKQEFKQQFKKKFNEIDKDIQLEYNLDDEQYKKLFYNSCIFCDIADCVANNIVLECIKYNTPIIVRRLPSIEEYLGVDYPLFFNDDSELKKLQDEKLMVTKIRDANFYLKKLNKKQFTLQNFSNKINYDINKLKINNDTYKLTWFCYLKNENDDIEKYISVFNYQISKENIKLVIINCVNSKKEILEKYKSDNIKIINIEEKISFSEVFNIFIENSTTEYLTFKSINNICNEDTYSDICINYFEHNPTFDVIFFKNNKIENNFCINEYEIINEDHSVNSNSDNSYTSDNCKNNTQNDDKVNNNFDKSSNQKLLKNDEINYEYNFDKLNTNILWRKSIHDYLGRFEDNFWQKCYNNHLNIFEINNVNIS
jgi:hypothetical protein